MHLSAWLDPTAPKPARAINAVYAQATTNKLLIHVGSGNRRDLYRASIGTMAHAHGPALFRKTMRGYDPEDTKDEPKDVDERIFPRESSDPRGIPINVAHLEYGRRANEEPEQETMDEDAEDTMYEKNDPAGKAFNPTSINEHFGIFTNDTTAAMHRGACT